MEKLTDWIGRTEVHSCTMDPWRAQALHATLDSKDAPPLGGDPLPPCWHWSYFLDSAPSRELGPDGHPARGGFLPPVPLPRRMWAGSRLEFFAALRIGAPARRVSSVVDVREKSGRSGRLCFVTVRHETFAGETADAALAIREEQDIVYREPARTASAAAIQTAPARAQWMRAWVLDAPRLFRYSALTFNSHRIHYDRDYATQVEGYPGLVVHGPLLATLMLEVVREQRAARQLRTFEFRALAPLFDDGGSVRACAIENDETVSVWVADDANALHMQGSATFY